MVAGSAPRRALACAVGLLGALGGAAPAGAGEHPLVLFSQSDLPALRAKVQTEPAASWWATTAARADEGLSIDFTDVTLSEYDKSLRASCLAFAYLITEDTQYRDKGIEALVNVGSGSFDGLAFNWHAGVVGTNYGLAYDWLYNELSAAQLDTVQNKPRGLGDMCQRSLSVLRDDPIDGPWYEGDYWTGHGGTHGNQRLLPEAALGVMAIALDDYDDPVRGSAQQWRDFVREHLFGTAYPELYGPYLEKMTPGGVYNEGFSYHTDSSHALYPYLLAELRRGELTIDAIEPLINSWVALAMPNRRTPVFEDSLMGTAPADITAFAPLSPNGPQYTWLWAEAQAPVPYSRPFVPIIFFDPSVAPVEPSYTTQFLGDNYVVFRSDWSEDATYLLALAQSAPRRLHLQPCQGSFQLYAKRAYLAIDPGYGHANGDAIQNGRAHNLIGVDGIGTSRYDSIPSVVASYTQVRDPAYLREHFTTPFGDFADVEVDYDTYTPEPYGEEVELGITIFRSYLFPGKKYFVIADEVSSPAVHDYQWYLHFGLETEGQLRIDGSNAFWQTTNADGAEVELGAYFVSPAVQITSGTSATEIYQVDADPPHVFLQAETSASDVDYLTVLFPRLLSEPAPAVETLTDVSGGTGVQIDSDVVLLRDRAEAAVSSTQGGLGTDARLSLVSAQAGELDYFMAKSVGTFSYQGSELLSATAALPAVALQYGASTIHGSLEAPSDGAAVTLRHPGIEGVTADGQPVELTERGAGYVVFPWSGKHELVADLAAGAGGAGSDGGSSAGGHGAGAEPSDDGCGCRTAGRARAGAGLAIWGAMLGVALVGRRRARRGG